MDSMGLSNEEKLNLDRMVSDMMVNEGELGKILNQMEKLSENAYKNMISIEVTLREYREKYQDKQVPRNKRKEISDLKKSYKAYQKIIPHPESFGE